MIYRIIRALIKIINLISVTLSFSGRAKSQHAESFWVTAKEFWTEGIFKCKVSYQFISCLMKPGYKTIQSHVIYQKIYVAYW